MTRLVDDSHMSLLARMIETLPDTRLVVDGQGHILHAALGSGGTGRTSISAGSTLDDLGLPRDVLAILRFHMEQTLQTAHVQQFEYDLPFEDGLRYYEARLMPLAADQVMILIRDFSFMKTVNQQLSDSLTEITTLRAIENEITDTLNINYVLAVSLDAAMRLSNAQAGWIATFRSGDFHLAQAIGAYNSTVVEQRLRESDSIWARVAYTQEAVYIHALAERVDVPPLLPTSTSAMIIPMSSQDRLQGLMHLESHDLDKFTYSRFETITLMARRVATTLENAYLYSQEQEQVEELQRLAAELGKLEQLKTDMIRIASHDLRGPLAAIMGYVEMMQWGEEKYDKATRGYLQQIEQSARQMQRIINGILSLERIDEIARSRLSEVFDLAQMARRAFEDATPSMRLKHQTMGLHIHREPIFVRGDSLQMHEAIANLLNNAIKYTPDEGSITLIVDEAAARAILRVEDTGYGIPEAQQARLFQPFFRAKTQETQGIEGTGLGLHLVKNIIERHGGQMIFHSTRGKGSVFGFELDVVKS